MKEHKPVTVGTTAARPAGEPKKPGGKNPRPKTADE